jgi:uncharacterized protein (TIGR00375 family)
MAFHADLHVHSKYSRATSRDLDLEHLAWWAARKGIAVVGSGDCVHPVWLAELKDKLQPIGNGLFRLLPHIEAEVGRTLPPSCRAPVHFMLSAEISTIYKKDERTRKIHHLIFAPDFASVDRLAASLARVGNIASDGRPILGLDSRNLLEIGLQSGPQCYLVPAHIWTPWFAALGSQSGFDSIAECYGDLAGHVFAVETGLSSDPPMNWRVSGLDGYRLMSNSDAHSPAKLGREATCFSCAADYFAIRRALETGEGYGGTVEFFPEEGKYHLDGHRACDVRLEPRETLAHVGLCPVCGSRVTVGVAHRVELLADRSEPAPPPTAGKVKSLVPLAEILSEIIGSGVAGKAVTSAYDRTTAALGPELSVLSEVPVEDLAGINPLLGEAVRRLRSGSVIRQAGYDGQYGVIRLFEDGELDRLTRGALLFEVPGRRRRRAALPAATKPGGTGPMAAAVPAATPAARGAGVLASLDADQCRAAEAIDGPLVVVAGPGSGKTRMLTHRLAHLVVERGVPASSCLAVTFTRRATDELAERLGAVLPPQAGRCVVHSFHSLGLAILRTHPNAVGLAAGFRVADDAERAAALAAALGEPPSRAARLLKDVSLIKRTGRPGSPAAEQALAVCRRLSAERNWVDFDDLVGLAVEVLDTDTDVRNRWRARFRHVCIDEFQDVDEQQYRLLRCLVAANGNICLIGDPNQAIYGFRGADATCFARFSDDFPMARTMQLGRNYRSTGTIATAAAQVIGSGCPHDIMRPMHAPITLHTAPTERDEAEFVAAAIEGLLGGHDMLAAGRQLPADGPQPLGFADFAVLYRTDAQAAAVREAFDRAGIPFKKSSPAPIAAQASVRAVLHALESQDAAGRDAALAERVAAAADHVRRTLDGSDAAALAEARHWLAALARAVDAAHLAELVALSTEADFWDARADRVSLLTMHAAKGLEFSVVFVVGVEDGLIPFSWTRWRGDDGPGGTGDALDDTTAEERRLFYVAMTRAKDRLYLTRAARRSWRGRLLSLPPSRFLGDIAGDLLSVQRSAARSGRSRPRQYTLF